MCVCERERERERGYIVSGRARLEGAGGGYIIDTVTHRTGRH